MGLFGAAQAVAFSVGDLLGPVSSDIAHLAFAAPATAYAAVFLLQVCLFIAAAALATRVFPREQAKNETTNTNRTHAAVAAGGPEQGGR
jgi:BCD family chlorophyll transporter-like MFS transporter